MVILHFLATVIWIAMLLGFLIAVFWVIVAVVFIRGLKRWVHGDQIKQDLIDESLRLPSPK